MVKLTKAQIAEKEFQELKDSWSTLLVSLISKINSSKFIQHDTEIEYDTLVIVFTDTLDDTTYTLPVYAENLTKNYSYEYYQLLNDVDRHIQEIEEE